MSIYLSVLEEKWIKVWDSGDELLRTGTRRQHSPAEPAGSPQSGPVPGSNVLHPVALPILWYFQEVAQTRPAGSWEWYQSDGRSGQSTPSLVQWERQEEVCLSWKGQELRNYLFVLGPHLIRLGAYSSELRDSPGSAQRNICGAGKVQSERTVVSI